MKTETFDKLARLIEKHGKNYPDPKILSGCHRINLLLLEIFYELNWYIDRNVEHIAIKLLGQYIPIKTIYGKPPPK